MLKNYFIATFDKTNIAFPITSVFGVYPMSDLTSVPNAPEHVLGVAVIRQMAVPIVCLKHISALPQADFILILENNQDRFGLVIEQAKGIFEIPTEEIKAIEINQRDTKPFGDYTLGVWANSGEPVWLMNPALLRLRPDSKGGVNPEKMVWASLENIKTIDKREDNRA